MHLLASIFASSEPFVWLLLRRYLPSKCARMALAGVLHSDGAAWAKAAAQKYGQWLPVPRNKWQRAALTEYGARHGTPAFVAWVQSLGAAPVRARVYYTASERGDLGVLASLPRADAAEAACVFLGAVAGGHAQIVAKLRPRWWNDNKVMMRARAEALRHDRAACLQVVLCSTPGAWPVGDARLPMCAVCTRPRDDVLRMLAHDLVDSIRVHARACFELLYGHYLPDMLGNLCTCRFARMHTLLNKVTEAAVEVGDCAAVLRLHRDYALVQKQHQAAAVISNSVEMLSCVENCFGGAITEPGALAFALSVGSLAIANVLHARVGSKTTDADLINMLAACTSTGNTQVCSKSREWLEQHYDLDARMQRFLAGQEAQMRFFGFGVYRRISVSRRRLRRQRNAKNRSVPVHPRADRDADNSQ